MATKEERLSEAIHQLAKFSVVDSDMPAVLRRVARLATDTVAGADAAGLTMTVDGRLQTPVFTDEGVPEIDSAQYETGVGPCLDSYLVDRPWIEESVHRLSSGHFGGERGDRPCHPHAGPSRRFGIIGRHGDTVAVRLMVAPLT